MNDKNRPRKNNSSNNEGNKPHAPRTTIDDPENDIFDDEIFDDESVMPKASPNESETFEKPW